MNLKNDLNLKFKLLIKLSLNKYYQNLIKYLSFFKLFFQMFFGIKIL